MKRLFAGYFAVLILAGIFAQGLPVQAATKSVSKTVTKTVVKKTTKKVVKKVAKKKKVVARKKITVGAEPLLSAPLLAPDPSYIPRS